MSSPPNSIAELADDLPPALLLTPRSDGRTLSQLYIELPSLDAAQKLVRLTQGKKLRGRPVSVVLATMSELLEHVSWHVLREKYGEALTLLHRDRFSPTGCTASTAPTLESRGAKAKCCRLRTLRD